jgi:hypothetical protein
VHWYLCEGLSTYRIASLAGLTRHRVARLLRGAGVALRPRGAGGRRPQQRRADPPGFERILASLYLDRGLTVAQTAAVLGIPARTLHDRLARYGIQTRTRGGWERADRLSLPSGVLWDLYHRDGMAAEDVARKLGTSRKAVLRAAHELGIPVRAGGAVTAAGPGQIELIRALYDDELIAATLGRHGVPQVPPGGPVWRRFPEPVPLSGELVADLYWHCGAGLSHIELLTGQPVETVRAFMRRSGIPMRHPGGRTPFLRRWQAVRRREQG